MFNNYNIWIHAYLFQSMMRILLNKIMGNEGVEDFEAVEDAEAGIDGRVSKGWDLHKTEFEFQKHLLL